MHCTAGEPEQTGEKQTYLLEQGVTVSSVIDVESKSLLLDVGVDKAESRFGVVGLEDKIDNDRSYPGPSGPNFEGVWKVGSSSYLEVLTPSRALMSEAQDCQNIDRSE